jgi:hypothetical protein
MTALLLIFGLMTPAQAHEGHIDGAWRVHSVINGEETLSFPDSLATDGKTLVFGRWLWVFGDNKLTMASQVLNRTDLGEVNKGKRTVEASDFAWCGTQISVDIGWNKGTMLMPKGVQAETSVARHDKKNKPIAVEKCSVRLNGVQSLTPVRGAEGAPEDAITMVAPGGQLKFVLVRDNIDIDVDALIK